jgi:predicted RNA-binding protein with RPS1 domain
MRKAIGFGETGSASACIFIFAGHGFTSGALIDPALFTAQAHSGDTAHIAGLRYASKIRNAGFFDEIVLVMDCCQDVLKASQVLDPTWNPPDNSASDKVMLMEAYAAPRGKKSREAPNSSDRVRGYFSDVFLRALRNAPADAEGYVTARAVKDTVIDSWVVGGYSKLTGVTEPPINGPRSMRLYRRGIPPPPEPRPEIGDPDGDGPTSPGSFGPLTDNILGESLGGDFPPSHHRQSFVYATISSLDAGALIRILDRDRREIASGIGQIHARIEAGQYTARFRVGDEVQDRQFECKSGDIPVRIENGLLPFSSPIPLENTSTNHEYHYDPAMKLRATAVERAYRSGFRESVGTLMVFARDSAHDFKAKWPMRSEMRAGLRVRKLSEKTGEPVAVPCEVIVDVDCGYCSLLLNNLSPGTYLFGVRRLQRDYWSWQEIALTVAPSWCTEVYLDCIDDDWTERRFDIESASVRIAPGTRSESLFDSDARFTEVARLTLLEARLGMDSRLVRVVRDVEMPDPMLALYTAYALTLSSEPDFESIRRLCKHLSERWTSRSADVKILERWCAVIGDKSDVSSRIRLKPDEPPMIACGWELSRRLGVGAKIALGAQYHVGMWRTSSLMWTQTQVPEMIEVREPPMELSADLSVYLVEPGIILSQIARKLDPPRPTHSPLQQSIRRTLIEAAESEENTKLGAFTETFSKNSGMSSAIIRLALIGLLEPSSATTVGSISESISAALEASRPHFEAFAEVGKNYLGKVVRLADFGAFLELFPGTNGLLHISEIGEQRIRDVRDELKLGDVILVKVLAIEGNRIRLSRKAILREQQEKLSRKTEAEGV